jgi:glutathione synthase
MPACPRLLWLTDPWHYLDHPRDTTLRLAQETLALGVECFWADVRSLAWSIAGTTVEPWRVARIAAAREARSFELERLPAARLSDFDQVHYRVDPPVDLGYLHPLLLVGTDLELRAQQDGACATELVNPLGVLLGFNEKLAMAFCPELAPPSLASARWEPLCEFGRREAETVAKPLHQCQSKGVELLAWREASEIEQSREYLRALSDDFRRPVLLQRFLRGVHQGETRLWLVDGVLLACARKAPAPGTFRIDMDRGGSLAPHALSVEEQAAVPVIAAELRRRRIRLAAVDLIDGFVTDFNFTSPGLLPSMEAVVGRNLARPVLEALLAPFGERAPAPL